ARSPPRRVRRLLQRPPLPREPEQPDSGRYLLRPRPNHSHQEAKYQAQNPRAATTAASPGDGLNFNPMGSTLPYFYAQLVQHVLTTYTSSWTTANPSRTTNTRTRRRSCQRSRKCSTESFIKHRVPGPFERLRHISGT